MPAHSGGLDDSPLTDYLGVSFEVWKSVELCTTSIIFQSLLLLSQTLLYPPKGIVSNVFQVRDNVITPIHPIPMH